ncbi:hypothetical protein Aglo03_40400 [Actinokineospora globicatena]|uniref:Uncharacterized protein n=1 Tax=Actinokineospora globicatena TaxID=103729 RepID=A0A9W6QRB7_9PSEU|nr:hypothetical protein Aglo03_40400 [Actinokineospora globicatena]
MATASPLGPALGSESGPASSRPLARVASTVCKVGLCGSHLVKCRYIVSHGGKSAGSFRHAHPVRATYKISNTLLDASSLRTPDPLDLVAEPPNVPADPLGFTDPGFDRHGVGLHRCGRF